MKEYFIDHLQCAFMKTPSEESIVCKVGRFTACTVSSETAVGQSSFLPW